MNMVGNRATAGESRRRFLHSMAAGLGAGVGLSRTAMAQAAQATAIEQPVSPSPLAFIRRTFQMRDEAVRAGDQGYGAVIVNGAGEIVAQAPSRVVGNTDPTAHAEMEAIRDATRRLGTRDLSDHVMYSSSRPCPMCEAAAYWASLSRMVYGPAGSDAGPPRLCR